MPVHKWSFCRISASCSKNNARNIMYMPVLIFFAVLNLRQKSSFMDRHYFDSDGQMDSCTSCGQISHLPRSFVSSPTCSPTKILIIQDTPFREFNNQVLALFCLGLGQDNGCLGAAGWCCFPPASSRYLGSRIAATFCLANRLSTPCQNHIYSF